MEHKHTLYNITFKHPNTEKGHQELEEIIRSLFDFLSFELEKSHIGFNIEKEQLNNEIQACTIRSDN